MPMDFPERFNMADYFLYHNLEEGRENKVCLYFEDKTFTYGEAARMSNRVGNALRMLGVRMEDRVLIVLPDCPEFVWTWFGAARIGAMITGTICSTHGPARRSCTNLFSSHSTRLFRARNICERCWWSVTRTPSTLN